MECAGVDQCRPWPTIAVNDAYRLAPWADVLYACDGKWWDVHIDHVKASGFSGQLWTQDEAAARRHGLRRIVGHAGRGLNRAPGYINFGNSSGYQAINAAWHWGARRLVLLGFDCTPVGGKRHWFGDHPAGLNNPNQVFAKWQERFPELARDLRAEGVEVFNCSPVSALRCWPKVSVGEALASRLSDPLSA